MKSAGEGEPKPNAGRGKSRLNPYVEQIIREVICRFYLSAPKCRFCDLRRKIEWAITAENAGRVENQKLILPCVATIRRRLLALQKERVIGKRKGVNEFLQR